MRVARCREVHRLWTAPVILALSSTIFSASFTSAQQCAESNQVTFPGFICCKDTLDSDSGWKLLCSTNGEIPTEPPEAPPSTEPPGSKVTLPSDPNRFSKAVKVSNDSTVDQSETSSSSTESSRKTFPAGEPLSEDGNSLQASTKQTSASSTAPSVADSRGPSVEQPATTDLPPAPKDPNAPPIPLEYPSANSIEVPPASVTQLPAPSVPNQAPTQDTSGMPFARRVEPSSTHSTESSKPASFSEPPAPTGSPPASEKSTPTTPPVVPGSPPVDEVPPLLHRATQLQHETTKKPVNFAPKKTPKGVFLSKETSKTITSPETVIVARSDDFESPSSSASTVPTIPDLPKISSPPLTSPPPTTSERPQTTLPTHPPTTPGVFTNSASQVTVSKSSFTTPPNIEVVTHEASMMELSPSTAPASNSVSTTTATAESPSSSSTSDSNRKSENDPVLSETTSNATNVPASSLSPVVTHPQRSSKSPTTPKPEAVSDQDLRLSSTRFSEPSTTPASRTRSRRFAGGIDDFILSSEYEAVDAAVEIEYHKSPFGSSFKVLCNSASPNVPSLLVHLGISDIMNVEFKNCSVPQGRLRYSKLLEGNRANVSYFELNQPHGLPDGVLTGKLFDAIAPTIVELHVTRSTTSVTPMNALDDDFFKEFSSLRVLRLVSNALTSLPSSSSALTKLSHLDLSMNRISEVTSSMFTGLQSLIKLHLSKNPIMNFQSRPFADLKRLTVLELNAINVTEVGDDLFEGLNSLSYLKLDWWFNIRRLPENLFSKTPNLAVLTMTEAMSLEELPGGIFSGLSSLNTTNLRSCNLATIPPQLFADAATSLKVVDLSNNRLKELPTELFLENTKLEKLNLAANQLETLKDEFKMLYALKELNLMQNNITEISEEVFEHQINLQLLHLASNKIAKIDSKALYHLKRLESLYLQDNLLESFGSTIPTFSNGSPIREIFLARNRLTSFPRIQFQSLPKLAKMDLDGNLISFFAVPQFMSQSTKIFARNNRIDFVSVDLAKNYPKIDPKYNTAVGDHEFYLEGNPFKCDCNIYGMIRYIRKEMRREVAEFVNADEYRCDGSDESLLKLRLDMLSCKQSDCPSGCECSLRAFDSSLHVSCKNLGLTSVPDLPANLTHLDFEGNLLTKYPEELKTYPKLREIILDDNNITNIDAVFAGRTPPSLEMLSFAGNRLERLRPQVKNTTFKMALSRNPWICDCTALDFKRFVRSNVANIPDFSRIQCGKPFVVNGTKVSLLNDIRDEIFCPPDTSAYRAMMVAISIAFLISLVLIALYYKNRQLIVAYVYIHFYNVFICFFTEGDLDEDKKFDAFISYSSNDRDVAMAILQELEKPQGDESSENLFKLCIHERDWLPGYNISWNIVNSVQNSKRTILILSQDFLKSLWFEVEFRTAYVQMMEDRINRLIVVIKDEIPPKDTLDSDLRYLLSTKTYLEWNEKWFWEKLKYAMPHKGNLSGPIKNKMKPSELHKVLPMNVILNKNNIPNGETVVRVEDAIESAREKRNSPDDSTYGSMSDSLRDSGVQSNRGGLRVAEGHVNRGYEPVSTENIHAISSQPDPIDEPKPAPRASRKREAPKPKVESAGEPTDQQPAAESGEKKPPPVKSARVRPGPLPQTQ